MEKLRTRVCKHVCLSDRMKQQESSAAFLDSNIIGAGLTMTIYPYHTPCQLTYC